MEDSENRQKFEWGRDRNYYNYYNFLNHELHELLEYRKDGNL